MSVMSINTVYSIEIQVENEKNLKKTTFSKEDFFRKVKSEMLEVKETWENKKNNFCFTLGKMTSSKRKQSKSEKIRENQRKLSTNEKNQQESVFKKLNLDGIDLNEDLKIESNPRQLPSKRRSPMKSYSKFTSSVIKEIKYPSLKRTNSKLQVNKTYINSESSSSSVILIFFSVGIMIILILAIYNNENIINSLPSLPSNKTFLIPLASLTITLILILQIVSFQNTRKYSRFAKEDYSKLVIIAEEWLEKHEKPTFFLLQTEIIKKFAFLRGMNVENYSKNVFSLMKTEKNTFFYSQIIEGEEYLRII